MEKGQIVKVSPAISFGVPRKVTPLQITGASDWDASREIEEQKRIKALEEEHRYNTYLDILLGKPDDNWHYYHGLLGLGSILLSNLLCSILTFIPMHNVILEPFYWYETLIQASTGFFSSCAAYMLLNCCYWMNTDRIKSVKNFFIFYVFLVFIALAVGISVIMIWTEALGFRHPMPFFGMIMAYIVIVMSFVGLWFLYPRNWRKNKEMWKRFKFFMWSILANLFITMIYNIYTKAFTTVPIDYQWGLALFLIPVREFNMWLQNKVATKAAGVEATSVDITTGHNINNRHCFFLSVVLGTTATDITCWAILAVDFSINMFLMIRVIWIRRKGITEKNEKKMVHTFMELIMAETVEIAVPLTYLSCFLVAYYGPNAVLLGGVRCDMWHYVAVTDLTLFLENVGLFLFADVVSLTTTAVCMGYFAKVNVIRAFVTMQKEFWLIMAVNTAYTVNMVRY